jgi:hypothetical protein
MILKRISFLYFDIFMSRAIELSLSSEMSRVLQNQNTPEEHCSLIDVTPTGDAGKISSGMCSSLKTFDNSMLSRQF